MRGVATGSGRGAVTFNRGASPPRRAGRTITALLSAGKLRRRTKPSPSRRLRRCALSEPPAGPLLSCPLLPLGNRRFDFSAVEDERRSSRSRAAGKRAGLATCPRRSQAPGGQATGRSGERARRQRQNGEVAPARGEGWRAAGGGGASLLEAERLLPRGGSHASEFRRGSGSASGRQRGSQSGGRASERAGERASERARERATPTPVTTVPRRGASGRGRAVGRQPPAFINPPRREEGVRAAPPQPRKNRCPRLPDTGGGAVDAPFSTLAPASPRPGESRAAPRRGGRGAPAPRRAAVRGCVSPGAAGRAEEGDPRRRAAISKAAR